MSEYRRNYIPGGTFFLTLVTYKRIPLFSNPENIHGRASKCRVMDKIEKILYPY